MYNLVVMSIEFILNIYELSPKQDNRISYFQKSTGYTVIYRRASGTTGNIKIVCKIFLVLNVPK